jgi:hypothetical protein
MDHIASVFANAAIPQKLVFLALLAAVPAILVGAVTGNQKLVAALGRAGLLAGLLTAALNGFHMADTITRLPFDPTAKQLAPGIFEVSTLVCLGALVGIVSCLAGWVLAPRAG